MFHPERYVVARTIQKVKHFGQLAMGMLCRITFSIAEINPRWLADTHENVSIAISFQCIMPYAPVATLRVVVMATAFVCCSRLGGWLVLPERFQP